VINNL